MMGLTWGLQPPRQLTPMIAPDQEPAMAGQRGHIRGDAFMRSLLSSGFAALLIKTTTAGLSYLMFVYFARFLSSGEFGKICLRISALPPLWPLSPLPA